MNLSIVRKFFLPGILLVGLLSIIATGGGGGGGSSPGGGGSTGGLPPDPAGVAPLLNKAQATSFLEATAFLYSGADPIQSGVAADTIDARRAAVLRGRVIDRAGEALTGVVIRVLDYPELGQTLSRADGRFDLAVNGGGWLTLDYHKDGYLTAQRRLQVPWQDYVPVEAVVLVALDPVVTQVDLGAPGMKVARGSAVTDSDGERRATLLVPDGVSAQAVMADGSTRSLTLLDIRATEFTVGESGPEAMPAQLPPASAYTYALEYSVDQALDAMRVEFSQPLIHYSEDFIGFSVGSAVPTGYYDREQGLWIASDNGRVVKLLAIENGLAVLDTDGDNSADDAATLAALGVGEAEREQLAALYSPGQALWRVPIPHFTPWDCNWPYGPPEDAIPPPDKGPRPEHDPEDDPCEESGSILECQNQVLGETLPVAGTSFSLRYRSDRQSGHMASRTVTVPLIGTTIPDSLQAIQVSMDIAGRHLAESILSFQANDTYTFTWDGKDAYGRIVQGLQPYTVKVRYIYPVVYYDTRVEQRRAFARATGGGQAVIVGARSMSTLGIERTWQGVLSGWDLGWSGLGGWSLDLHHRHDPQAQVLWLGSGESQYRKRQPPSLIPVGGGGDSPLLANTGLPQPADDLRFDSLHDFVVAPDGSLYFTLKLQHAVYRLTPDRQIERFSSDNLLTRAGNTYDENLAFGPDGRLYLAQWGTRYIGFGNSGPQAYVFQLLRFQPDGTAEAVYGRGPGYDVNYTSYSFIVTPPAVNDMVVGADGSIYFTDENDLLSDWPRNHRVFRLAPDGSVETVAGNGTNCASGPCGDAGAAVNASVPRPQGLALDGQGNLFILTMGSAAGEFGRVRRVSPDGRITTAVGCIVQPCSQAVEGVDALSTLFQASPDGLAVTSTDNLAFVDESGGVNNDSRKIYVTTADGELVWLAGVDRGHEVANGYATQVDLGGPFAIAGIARGATPAEIILA